ncbi:MAG: paraquat-inducible protein A [Halopseudomonas sp.]
MLTAQQQGLIHCSCCGLIQQQLPVQPSQRLRCRRCHSALYSRQPHSSAKSLALSLAALVMLIPANLYPMMIVSNFAGEQPDTILSGIVHLAHSDQIIIAAVVFIASIAVPVLKLIGLGLLLLATKRHWHLSPRQCTLLYRMVEFIGRWSMLDLFVIAILMALVSLGQIVEITAGPAATAFLSAVILTMLAAISFDPRLLWDLQYDPPSQQPANTPLTTEPAP